MPMHHFEDINDQWDDMQYWFIQLSMHQIPLLGSVILKYYLFNIFLGLVWVGLGQVMILISKYEKSYHTHLIVKEKTWDSSLTEKDWSSFIFLKKSNSRKHDLTSLNIYYKIWKKKEIVWSN